MWPWEHVIFAYVIYSLGCRLFGTTPSSRAALLLLVFGALLPDLIDKPLAWHFGIFHTSYSIGHSVLLAIPASFVAVGLAVRFGHPRLGIAFAVGYLSHLIGDLIPTYVREGNIPMERVMWPVMETEPSPGHGGLLDGFWNHFEPYLVSIRAGDPSLYLIVQLGLGILALVLWAFDGFPGIR